MRIDEYIKSLPGNITSGEDVALHKRTARQILDFAALKPGERFCHLGCGRGEVLAEAAAAGARVIGIDTDSAKIAEAQDLLGKSAELLVGDITSCDIPPADVVLFWFADPDITYRMVKRLGLMALGTRVVTIWGPLPGCLPHEVRFPFVMCRVPFKTAPDLASQVRAVFGVRCVSYATAWEYAERYIKAIQPDAAQNDRFLTILQALTIWFSARSLGVACEKVPPRSVRTYTEIMRRFFGIEFGA